MLDCASALHCFASQRIHKRPTCVIGAREEELTRSWQVRLARRFDQVSCDCEQRVGGERAVTERSCGAINADSTRAQAVAASKHGKATSLAAQRFLVCFCFWSEIQGRSSLTKNKYALRQLAGRARKIGGVGGVATSVRHSPSFWWNILSNVTSPIFSRCLCMTLRTLKIEKTRNYFTSSNFIHILTASTTKHNCLGVSTC